jgi:RNA polymerase sigma factor for flagellar operon FliA
MSAAEVLVAPRTGEASEERAKRVLTREDYDRFLPLVRRTAMKLARRLPSHVTVADLVSYGWIGLVEAFDRARPDMSTDEFEAYALYRVRGAILDHLRTLDPASRAARALSRRLARALTELTNELKRAPEEEEVAVKLEMTLQEYRQSLEHLGRVGMNRLEMLDIDEVSVGSDVELPEDHASRRELCGVVAEAIGKLPERLKLVLALYYQEERSMREIGIVLEISESRVCQLHTEALHRLRAAAGKD